MMPLDGAEGLRACRSRAEDLEGDRARARAIELGEDDALPLAADEAAAADRERGTGSQEERAKVGRGVAAVAVGVAGIVVAPGSVGADRLFELGAEVFEEGVLPFVDEEGGGGVERLQEGDAFLDSAFRYQVFDELGEVDELELLEGGAVEYVAEGGWDCERRCGLHSEDMVARVLANVKYFVSQRHVRGPEARATVPF
jgi:hypothetical protein